MPNRKFEILTAADARRALTNGDLRSEIAFQNDINILLARLDEKNSPLRALAGPQPGPSRARARLLPWRT